MWLESEKIHDLPYALAARMVLRLTGLARTRANELAPSQLRADPGIYDEATGQEISPPDWLRGINTLLVHLESGMHLRPAQRPNELRTLF